MVFSIRSLTFDAVTVRGRFKPSTAAEKAFYRQLKKVAEASGHIIDQHIEGHEAKLSDSPEMMRELERYAKKLTPWATKQAARLIDQVQRSNKRAYQNKSKTIGRLLQTGVADSEIGMTAASLLFEQVDLIKSIPIEAGLRAQKIALEAVLAGTRAAPDSDTIVDLQRQLGLSTEVATSRALLISRTETARANSALCQARARSLGSGQYRWHNSGDEAVRHSHKFYKGGRLQGMIFSWDDPPTLEDGMTGHPGTFPNCRCFPEPIFGDE